MELESNFLQKSLFIKDLKPKETVRTSFLVKSKEIFYSKNGKPYLALLLSDSTGDLEGRVWENAEEMGATFNDGDIVAVGGKLHVFQNRNQLVIDHLIPIPAEEARVEDYLPKGNEDTEALYQKLLGFFESLENPWVKNLGLSLLHDAEIAPRYKVCPAAKTIHHAFIGGLLTHSVQLCHLIEAVLPLYPGIDRSLMIFGAAFHDFGKIFELSYQGKFGYTDEGKLVGHIAIGVVLIDRKIREIPNFPKELELHLKHLILSHHGKLEHGSPKRPHTLEAELLHQLDHMDSRINSIQTFIQSENNTSRWSGYHKTYDQYYFKPISLVPSEPQ
jgi:3'-5' exoribonuclease